MANSDPYILGWGPGQAYVIHTYPHVCTQSLRPQERTHPEWWPLTFLGTQSHRCKCLGFMSSFTALSNVGTYNLPRMAHPIFKQKGWCISGRRERWLGNQDWLWGGRAEVRLLVSGMGGRASGLSLSWWGQLCGYGEASTTGPGTVGRALTWGGVPSTRAPVHLDWEGCPPF